MAASITDKTICRYCKQGPPAVSIKYAKGKPLGECHSCNRERQLVHRLKVGFYKDIYTAIPELISVNTKILGSVRHGAYALIDRASKARAGFLVYRPGAVYIEAFGLKDLFHIDLWGIGLYLANRGLFIGAEIGLESPNGDSLPIESAGQGLPLENVADRLVMYDVKLREHAVKVLRDEIKQAKQANMAKARQAKGT